MGYHVDIQFPGVVEQVTPASNLLQQFASEHLDYLFSLLLLVLLLLLSPLISFVVVALLLFILLPLLSHPPPTLPSSSYPHPPPTLPFFLSLFTVNSFAAFLTEGFPPLTLSKSMFSLRIIELKSTFAFQKLFWMILIENIGSVIHFVVFFFFEREI